MVLRPGDRCAVEALCACLEDPRNDGHPLRTAAADALAQVSGERDVSAGRGSGTGSSSMARCLLFALLPLEAQQLDLITNTAY